MFKNLFGPFSGNTELSEYVSRYRRSDLPPIEVSEPLDLYPLLPATTNFSPKHTWANSLWQFSGKPGVYLIYSEAFELLYIGKASMNKHIGHRLWVHFGRGATCSPKGKEWLKLARFFITITVPKQIAFEAPAIEEFLIKKLQPKKNGMGK